MCSARLLLPDVPGQRVLLAHRYGYRGVHLSRGMPPGGRRRQTPASRDPVLLLLRTLVQRGGQDRAIDECTHVHSRRSHSQKIHPREFVTNGLISQIHSEDTEEHNLRCIYLVFFYVFCIDIFDKCFFQINDTGNVHRQHADSV